MLVGAAMSYQSYWDLEVFRRAYDLSLRMHSMSLRLPKFEMYEEGSQVRRSSKSVVSTIVEGFGRRRYVAEFVQYLTYALASCDETRVHLRILIDAGGLQDEELFKRLDRECDELGRKLNLFIQAVERGHMRPKSRAGKQLGNQDLGSRIQDHSAQVHG